MLLHQCARICDEARHLHIDEGALSVFAVRTPTDFLHVPRWDAPDMYQGPPDKVVAWFLAYNAINYSYWPESGGTRWWSLQDAVEVGRDDEALGVMAALGNAIDAGVPLDNGAYLAGISIEDLESLLAPAPGAGALPLFQSRLAGLRELGDAYLEYGGPMSFIEDSDRSSIALAQLLARRCPGWEDARVLRGERLRFLKRAQLCAAMIYGRFGGQGPGEFHDIDQLSVFADYRLPQVLRAIGGLRLDEDLEARIDSGVLLEEGSEEEVEIRCATVHASEVLRRALDVSWPGVTALQVDHLLWRSAVHWEGTLPPFHHTRTTDY